LRGLGMSEPKRSEVTEHLTQVGLICSQWAYLEWLLEIALWWLIGLLDDHEDARIMTRGLDIQTLSRRVRDLAHRKISDRDEKQILKRVACRIAKIIDDRNLVVHGVRSLQPDKRVLASVPRGPYRHKPEPLPLIRLRSINTEIAGIIAELEPLLADKNVIDGVTVISELRRYPQPR
jgi:hypothetical protein